MTQNPPLEFIIEENEGLISSLKRRLDPFDTEFIRPGKGLGSLKFQYKLKEEIHSCFERGDEHLNVRSTFINKSSLLQWKIRLKNQTDRAIEISSLELPFEFNEEYTRNAKQSFEGRVFKHSHIAGHNSFIFWLPVGGVGSHLLMTAKPKTHLEYFQAQNGIYASGGAQYSAFIHSQSSAKQLSGTWRQDNTSKKLEPGEEIEYGFNFQWADNYADIRNKIYQSGGIDLRVAPGMVVPQDLKVKLSLKSMSEIKLLKAEFADHTEITKLPNCGDRSIYEISFSKLGENKITLHYGDQQETLLEFFVTETLETLIKKRASFITEFQQHKDPEKWYDGLYSLWDAGAKIGQQMLGPDNTGSQHPYCTNGSDDPSNSKCMYLSEKNVAYPNLDEIESLEYFLKNFVWGKHQRTDKEEPYPYGIYGSDSWLTNRSSKNDPIEEGTSRPQEGGSQCRMWRTFDYTTYFAVYYNMYLIARNNPSLVSYLNADQYLERAFGTAKAFFEVPYNIMMTGGWAHEGWTDWAYTLGNFHEKYLIPLIASLREEGLDQKADYLKAEWEKKVKYFLYDDDYPFVSEMPVDSTAYESSYAIGKYALTKTLKPGQKLWQHKNTKQWYSHPIIDQKVHEDYLQRQLMANLACRGVLETSYYHYGSDFRAVGTSNYTMSYMSQMGGWAIMDQGLYFKKNRFDLIQLGYASLLCSWGLMNTGTEESNYGFWYDGKNNDGSVAWGFMPQKMGSEWNPACKDMKRGAWAVCGEIDHGLTAGVETAATIVAEDPNFGLIAYGGILKESDDTIRVISRDGVGRQFHFITEDSSMHIILKNEAFSKNKPIHLDKNTKEIKFSIERRNQESTSIELELQGLEAGPYELVINNEHPINFDSKNQNKILLKIPFNSNSCEITIKKRTN